MKKWFLIFAILFSLIISTDLFAAASLMPYPKFHAQTSTGAALSGGKLYTYTPGTTTPKATYSDSAMTVPNTNPVILDSNGDAVVYLDGLYDVVLKNSLDVVQWTMNNISGINSITSSTNTSEWVTQSLTNLTYVNAMQFSASTDLRTTFVANLRIKATVTAGTIYGTVTTSTFVGGTTIVTVLWDTRSLDSSLSAIYTGVLAPTNSSVPANFVPVGAIFSYAGATAPTGWLLCYGQAISRTTYAALFSAIGTTYGAGDGSTTFNVPDCRGRALIGLDNLGGAAASRVAAATTLGQSAGAETANLQHAHTTGDVTLTAAQSGLPSHSHTIYLTDNGGGPKNTVLGGVSYNITTTVTADAGGSAASQAHNHGSTGNGGSTTQAIMNPYIAISYIIKY